MNDKDTNILNIEIEEYEECDYCKSKKQAPQLKIPWAMWCDWKLISAKMGSKEWAAVFWVEDGAVVKYKIPKQEVSTGEVEVKEELGGQGLIHSHHGMGAFHSAQDDRHARNVYDYSIVVSKEESVCTKREKLPCGGYGYRDVEILLSECPDIDIANIKEKQYTYLSERTGHLNSDYRDMYEQQQNEERVYEEHCVQCSKYDCENCTYFVDLYAGTKS